MQVAVEKDTGRIRRRWIKPITVTDFEKWEAKQSGDCSYELYFREIIKKPGSKQRKHNLVGFLANCFLETAAKKDKVTLVREANIHINDERKHIAHLAYFNHKQLLSMADGKSELPAFIIDIISEKDRFVEIETKVADYFDVGVQLLWFVSPNSKQIYAYSAKDMVKIFTNGDEVEAAPVLQDFKVDIDKLFTIE